MKTSEQLNDLIAELEQDIEDAKAEGHGNVYIMHDQIRDLDIELDAAITAEEFIATYASADGSPYATDSDYVLSAFARAICRGCNWDIEVLCGWDNDRQLNYDAESAGEVAERQAEIQRTLK